MRSFYDIMRKGRKGVRWTRATARAEFLGIKLDLILKKSIIEL